MTFFVVPDDLTPKERMLVRRLERRYTQQILRTVLKPLIEQTSPVSLRVLDWVVVNFSKKHNIFCSTQRSGQMVNIHHLYRSTLAYWKRRLFDPFRRRTRIQVDIDGCLCETTLGQANFVLFTYESGILAFVIRHIDAVEDDMNVVSQQQKRDRQIAVRTGTQRRRKELTPSLSLPCLAYVAPSRVSFG